MLTLVMWVVLSQAEVGTSTEGLTPPPAPPAVVLEEPAPPRRLTPKPVRHSATLFSSPRVDGKTLVGRMALGFLGSVGGGTISAAILGLALISGGGSSATPFIIAAPFALASLGFGTALGIAAFGDSYADDLADAVIVSMVTSAIAAGAVIACMFLFAEAIVPMIIVAGLFPAVASPLFVQLFKKPSDPGLVVARF